MKRKEYTKEEKEMVKSIRRFKHDSTVQLLTGKSFKRPFKKSEECFEVENINSAADKDFSNANPIQKKCYMR